jgi:N-acetylglutamate synthase-like GNAT family acetyltransferase
VSDEEVVGFGGPISESPFGDSARLSSAWREPNHVGSEEVLVAEIDGRVVGCVAVEDRGEELELIDIDVPRDRQGRGIGTGLVRFVEERAREQGKRAVTLGTSRNSAGVPWKSFPWWQARGYRVTHEEENAYTRSVGPGVLEIRMRKNLFKGNAG